MRVVQKSYMYRYVYRQIMDNVYSEKRVNVKILGIRSAAENAIQKNMQLSHPCNVASQ